MKRLFLVGETVLERNSIIRVLVLLSVVIMLSYSANSGSPCYEREVTSRVNMDLKQESCTSKPELKSTDSTFPDELNLEDLLDFLKPVDINSPVNATISVNQTHYWIIEASKAEQLVYFNFNSSSIPLERHQVAVYQRNSDLNALRLTDDQINTISITEELLGRFSADLVTDYILAFNSTMDGNYTLLVTVPTVGYSYETAIPLTPGTPYLFTNTLKQQLFYWKVNLESNQLGTILIVENSTGILANTNLTIYDKPDGTILPPEKAKEDGSIRISWKRTEDMAADEYYAFLARPISNPIGNFTVVFYVQTRGYSFTNAIELEVNKSYSATVEYTGIFQEVTYYKVRINHSGVYVNFKLEELERDSNILEGATFQIYDPATSSRILVTNEEESFPDGTISGEFRASYAGYYYCKVRPRNIGSPKVANYSIIFTYFTPGSYQWQPIDVFINVMFVLLIPVVYYLDRRYLAKKGSSTAFSVNHPVDTVYKKFAENPRFSKSKIVPDARIIVERSQFSGMFRMEFKDLEQESLIFVWRYLRKFEMFMAILLVWLLYFGLNLIVYNQNFRSFLPWKFVSLLDLIRFNLAILIVIFAGYVLTTLYPNYTFNKFAQDVENVAKDVDKLLRKNSTPPMINREFIQRNMNYIRVLWNQARKAFSKKDFGTFIIKADSCVKKLVELRYMQLYPLKSNKETDPASFFQIIDNIRETGFDIPSERRIEHYRRLRNKVVHGSLLIEETTAIDAFSFYAKFLSRLGLRT
ncbi:MAG: collagen binding domain-containing protein [Candidatus Odinarchaeota archaeon]